MDWKMLLACITGSVEEHILLRNEYLAAENAIFRNQIKGRLHLSDADRQTLAEIGKKLGKQALEEIAKAAKPDTILGWHRKLVAQKFDGSDQRKSLGRPRVDKELEDWVVRMAKENRSWGYDRIAGALADLGYDISDQTVGNILKRRGLPSAPDRQKTTTWKDFIRRNLDGLLKPGQYLIHDRDTKFCAAFKHILDESGVKRLPLPAKSPNLNAIAERWIRSVKSEALSPLILFGERSLWYVLSEYVAHYHQERPHQGKGNVILFPTDPTQKRAERPIVCCERLGGLLKFYDREAA